jgi:hypothetical protein
MMVPKDSKRQKYFRRARPRLKMRSQNQMQCPSVALVANLGVGLRNARYTWKKRKKVK